MHTPRTPDSSLSMLPYHLYVVPDSSHPGCYVVVDRRELIWAQAVPTLLAAKLLASTPKLLAGYDGMRQELLESFKDRWDIPWSGPDLEELAADDGTFEDDYPGAPAFAEWLVALGDVLEDIGIAEGQWPIQEDWPRQLELL